MASQAKVVVTLEEHLRVNRAMRLMTNRTAFAQRFVLIDKRPGLLAMTRGTGLVQSCHGQAAGRFHDVQSVRVVALDTIKPPFDDRMALRQAELGVNLQMASETGRRIFARVDNKPPAPTPRRDMFAARPVTRFAAGHARHLRALEVDTSVRAERKGARDVRVAVEAARVSDKGRAFDGGRRHHCSLDARTRNQAECG